MPSTEGARSWLYHFDNWSAELFGGVTLKWNVFQLDCGIHPGMSGMEALPYTDMVDPEEIDLLLVSQ